MDGSSRFVITQVASSILTLFGYGGEQGMASPIPGVVERGVCDRVFLYNPDAIGEWISKRYPKVFAPLEAAADQNLEMLSVHPSVTPVCFASMYSGLLPKDHGIQAYVKPVLQCRTVFDALSEKGKKVAIVSTEGDSISLIFLGRQIDYYIYKTKEACNEKAKALIREDQYDLIVLYNGDYDYYMHRFTPIGRRSIKALKENVATFLEMRELVAASWKSHRTAMAFAPDHGCHFSFFPPGNHGQDVPSDMFIRHYWSFL